MNNKQAKKIRQVQRDYMHQYLEDILGYLRPKPKMVPRFLWTWMQKKVLRMDKIKPTL